MTPIALVTGASRGLGKNMAQHLARAGYDLILTYNSKKDEAEALAREIEGLGRKAMTLQLDVGRSSSFSAFVDSVRLGLRTLWQRDNIDLLINNAGIGINAPFESTTEEQFDQLVNIHLKGPFFLTQALLPMLPHGARIVNLSSGLARFCMPGYSAYGSLKAAVDTLTRYQAAELGSKGISVISIAPGAIETDFGGGVVRDNKQVNDIIASQTALGRVGLPDDIGGAVVALVGKDTRWINGQRIEVAGGIHL